jgi:hypothetical protein
MPAVTTAPWIGLLFDASVTVPCSVPIAIDVQPGSVNDPIRVWSSSPSTL